LGTWGLWKFRPNIRVATLQESKLLVGGFSGKKLDPHFELTADNWHEFFVVLF
jgi:hypothetical protein